MGFFQFCFQNKYNSFKGYCNFLLNKKAVWGEMSRKGFAGSKKKEKSGEREKGGES